MIQIVIDHFHFVDNLALSYFFVNLGADSNKFNLFLNVMRLCQLFFAICLVKVENKDGNIIEKQDIQSIQWKILLF